jgi:UDP-N-acetylmuramate--alanine ligase
VSAQDVAAWSDPVPSLDELGAVHFVGIGGAGMSGIARILLARGVRVSGSDRRDTPTLLALRALGARVEVGHDPAHLGSGKDAADTVVVSTAIRPDNPELATARERGLRVLPRAVALAAVMAGRRSIAVAGTHGKTSTTSMLTVAVQACGVDPSFAIGGDLNESGSNAHAGEGDIFVAEADESDRSFLLLAPFGAIVTNVEADHLDNYGDLAAVEAAFDRFL